MLRKREKKRRRDEKNGSFCFERCGREFKNVTEGIEIWSLDNHEEKLKERERENKIIRLHYP